MQLWIKNMWIHRILKPNNLIHLILLQKGYYPLK